MRVASIPPLIIFSRAFFNLFMFIFSSVRECRNNYPGMSKKNVINFNSMCLYLPYWLGIISGSASSVSCKLFGSPLAPTSRTMLVSLVIGVFVRLLFEWWWFRTSTTTPCTVVVVPVPSNWQSNGVADTWLCFAADFSFFDDFLRECERIYCGL